MITYDNLWTTMKIKRITQYRLIRYYGISSGQIGRLKKNKYISTHTVEVLCAILDCSVGEVMEYRPDPQPDLQPDPQLNPQTDPQPNPQTNPQSNPQPNPQPDPQSNPQPNPQSASLLLPNSDSELSKNDCKKSVKK